MMENYSELYESNLVFNEDKKIKVLLSKPINKLLSELPMDYHPSNYFVTIDKDENMIGFNEVLDGNHRLAIMLNENTLNKGDFYFIDYDLLSKKGYLDNQDNQDSFERFVKQNGKKISVDNLIFEEG